MGLFKRSAPAAPPAETRGQREQREATETLAAYVLEHGTGARHSKRFLEYPGVQGALTEAIQRKADQQGGR